MTSNTTVYKEGSMMNTTVNGSSFPSNGTVSPDAPPKQLTELYLLLTTLFFSIIISTGLVGNTLVMATLTRWREMRTPCNLLIANICAADLGVCVFAAPFRIIEIFRGWIFGDVMCYILTPLQDVVVVVSVITQTVIALERHRAIVAPFKPKMTLKRVRTSVVVIWIACYLTAGLPMMIFLKNSLHIDNGYYYCFPVFTNENYRIAYEMYLVMLFIVLPLVLQCGVYFDIIRVLRTKDEIHSRCSSFQPNSSQKKSFNDRIRQKKRLVKMLIVLMVAFQFCYIPRGVIMLLQEFTKTTSMPDFLYVDLITMAMYYLKHVINPFILWAMSHDFRAGCLNVCSVDDSHLSFIRESRYISSSQFKGQKRRLQNCELEK